MKKRNKWGIAALVHLVLWGVLLVVSAIDLLAVLCFPPMDTDMPLGYHLEKGILFLVTIVALVGVINGLLLFFSVRGAVASRSDGSRGKSTAALCLSLAATVAYYAFFILLFVVNKDWIQPYLLILALVWLVCAVCGGVLLVTPSYERRLQNE